MKKILLLILVMFSLFTLLNADYYTAVMTSNSVREDVSFLNKSRIDVDKVKGNQIYLYVSEDELAQLQAEGYDVEVIPNEAKEYADRLWEETKDTRDPMRNYYSYSEYVTFMQNTAADFPNICQLVDFGNSTNGNDLLFMKISDNAATDEAEPEVRYMSTIHGDEVVGYDFLIRLIDYLTSEYGTNTRVTNIVNNTEIWINPLFNPDGYLNHERYNANGVDLNRNFPTPTGNQHPDGNNWQVETQAVMNWSIGHYFTSSLMFHGGATVMNYPWDYTVTRAPDDALLQEMSLAYAEPYTAMYNSTEFDNGITNGYDWYQTLGSIQDWSYFYTNCFDITAEVYDTKWPNANLLDGLWNQNQESLLAYIEFAQNGVRGIVTDDSGNPLEAQITVSGNSKTVYSHAAVGDYHRILLPGTYTLTASLDGYRSQTIENIVVPNTGNITVNFTLQEAQEVTFNGIVRNFDGSLLSSGQIVFDTAHNYPIANDGSFIASVMQGDYQITIITGTGVHNANISLWETPENVCIVLGGSENIFSDDFESGLAQWTTSGSWGIETVNGSHALSDSPSGNYNNNINTNARTTSPINLNGNDATLSFDMYYDLEDGYDYGYLEFSTNGTSWQEIDSYNGTADWQNYSYILSGYTNLYLRFRLDTDMGVVAAGMKIDNLTVTIQNSIFGDFDADGLITDNDLDIISDYALNGTTPWGITDFEFADADDDGEITYMDAGLLSRYLKGTIGQLPLQSGVAINFVDPVINISGNSTQLNIGQDNPGDVYALLIDINSINHGQSALLNYQPGNYYAAGSYRLLYIPSAGYDQNSALIQLGYTPNTSSSITADVSCNGFESQLNIQSTDEGVNPLLKTTLSDNYPNPFNPTTTIAYEIAETGPVSLTVYDVRGRKVKTLVKAKQASGKYNIVWDGMNEAEMPVSSGVYFYRLSVGTKVFSKTMLLLK
ncbi:MAG: carboxypeptidase regulatory-like domain-containing protein [Candidatus Cloacimonetes bacterium]|nr:carboxypeptidase regulatory-like domain-containing protein [Candidatus Cloacimonadota bacterium]